MNEAQTVTVEFLGRARELRFTLATAQRVKKACGFSLLAGVRLSEEHVPTMLYESLVDKSDIASPDDITERLSMAEFTRIMPQLAVLLGGEDPEKNARRAQSSTSGPSPESSSD